MNIIKILFVIIAGLLRTSVAVINRPVEILNQFDDIELEIANFQELVLIDLEFVRYMTGDHYNNYFIKTVVKVREIIKKISISDREIRALLLAEVQNPCVLDLNNIIDQVIEMNGYAISNCIDVENAFSGRSSYDFTDQLDNLEKETNQLVGLIVNTLTHKNIYTETEEIISYIQDQFASKRSEINQVLDDLIEKAFTYYFTRDAEMKTLDICLSNINTSIKTSIAAVKARIPTCTKFSGRSARSTGSFFSQFRKFFIKN